jgi:hypothetical protein
MKRTHTIIEHDSTPEEWTDLRKQLKALEFDQIEQIAIQVGLTFTRAGDVTKEEYIDILDEAYWDELVETYEAVVGYQIK